MANETNKWCTVISGGRFESGCIDLRNLTRVLVSNCSLGSGAEMYAADYAKFYTVRMESGSELQMSGGYLQHAGVVGGKMFCYGSAACTFLLVHESGRLAAYGNASLCDINVYDGGHMCLYDKTDANKVTLDSRGTATLHRSAGASQVMISSGATMTMYDHSYANLVEIHSGGSLVLLDNTKVDDIILHSGGSLKCCDRAEYSYHTRTPTKLPPTVPYKRTTCTASADFYTDGHVVLRIPDLEVKGGTMSIVIEGKDSDAENV